MKPGETTKPSETAADKPDYRVTITSLHTYWVRAESADGAEFIARLRFHNGDPGVKEELVSVKAEERGQNEH